MLFEKYRESPTFQAKAQRTQRDDRRKLERVVAFLGPDRDAVSLSDSDVVAYHQARRRGDGRGTRVVTAPLKPTCRALGPC